MFDSPWRLRGELFLLYFQLNTSTKLYIWVTAARLVRCWLFFHFIFHTDDDDDDDVVHVFHLVKKGQEVK